MIFAGDLQTRSQTEGGRCWAQKLTKQGARLSNSPLGLFRKCLYIVHLWKVLTVNQMACRSFARIIDLWSNLHYLEAPQVYFERGKASCVEPRARMLFTPLSQLKYWQRRRHLAFQSIFSIRNELQFFPSAGAALFNWFRNLIDLEMKGEGGGPE